MDSVQLHLALNHVPVIGVPLLTIMLSAGWGFRQTQVIRFALWGLLVLVALSIAIKFTGDFAAETLQKELAEKREMVGAHEQSADQATTGVFLLAVAAAIALFAGRSGRLIPRWALALVLLLGIATSLLYARSAHTGGLINHPELRVQQRDTVNVSRADEFSTSLNCWRRCESQTLIRSIFYESPFRFSLSPAGFQTTLPI